MCGLFGVAGREPFNEDSLARARKARDCLTHRGPDQNGEAVDSEAYLGHRRLSILDLSEAGRQPMISDDSLVAITVNGEIYNFKSLRQELKLAGFKFRSQSDSEVVLHGFRHWGAVGLAERMDGMYAAVIHDRIKHEIIVIRDRAGVKPLYYAISTNGIAWSSEAKALLSWLGPDQVRSDPYALYDFLTYRFIPAPKTAWQNIFKLPQACILTYGIHDARVTVKPYWFLRVSERHEPDDVLAEELRSLMSASVSDQMIADVPVGFLISGGIDSSVVTLTGARLTPRPMTFSIGFSDPLHDESRYAAAVAAQAGTDHHVHILSDGEMDDLPLRMQNWFDEPFGDTSAVPTARVCAFARDYVTVALSGDGGDELFGGYKWYETYRSIRAAQRFLPFLPDTGIDVRTNTIHRRRIELLSTGDAVALYALLRGGLSVSAGARWRHELSIPNDYDAFWAYRAFFRPDLPPRKAAQVMDFHTYLPDDILTKVDRVSMAVSLECRPPFLARALIEFAYGLPECFIYRGNRLKGGLKYAYAGLLPENILNRGKQGFSVPDTGWRSAMIREAGSVQEAMVRQFLKSAA